MQVGENTKLSKSKSALNRVHRRSAGAVIVEQSILLGFLAVVTLGAVSSVGCAISGSCATMMRAGGGSWGPVLDTEEGKALDPTPLSLDMNFE